MKNLFSVGLRRFAGSPLSWIAAFVSLAAGIVTGMLSCYEVFAETYDYNAQYALIGLVIPLFLLIASVAGVVGRAQSEGTLRVKVIAGYTRVQIALAALLASALTSLLLGLLYLGSFFLTVRRAVTNVSAAHLTAAFLTLLGTFLLIGAAAAVLCLLVRRPVIAVLAVIGCAAGLSLAAIAADRQLDHPEYETTYTYIYRRRTEEAGEQIQVTRVVPGDFYVKPPARWLMLCLNKLNPAEHTYRALDLLKQSGTKKQLDRQQALIAAEQAVIDAAIRGETVYTEENYPRHAEEQLEILGERNYLIKGNPEPLEMRWQTANGEIPHAPQCMLAILIALSACGIACFRRQNLL